MLILLTCDRFMSLLAIPKVQPRFALAISKKYRTMRSLLNVYMDPSKTVSAALFDHVLSVVQ
jgi:crossover junction endonuclease EME1